MLEYVLLGFLTCKDLTGYEIKKKMQHSTSNFVDASFGSIYPALKRLETKCWIEAYEVQMGKKTTKKYQITEEGKQYFLKWLKTPIEYSPFNYEFLAKMFFFEQVDQGVIQLQLESVIEGIRSKLNGLEKLKSDAPHDIGGFEGDTLKFGIANYQSQLKWFENYYKNLTSE